MISVVGVNGLRLSGLGMRQFRVFDDYAYEVGGGS